MAAIRNIFAFEIMSFLSHATTEQKLLIVILPVLQPLFFIFRNEKAVADTVRSQIRHPGDPVGLRALVTGRLGAFGAVQGMPPPGLTGPRGERFDFGAQGLLSQAL
jgi:hypothetical protein